MYNDTGTLYDGCSMSMDSYGYFESTDPDGNYIGPYGGGYTTNTERGTNAGTFLTFGGNCSSSIRGNASVTVSAFSNGYGASPCQAIYSYINLNGGRAANANTNAGAVVIYYTFTASRNSAYTVNFGLGYGSV
jgi:hypothetical protein